MSAGPCTTVGKANPARLVTRRLAWHTPCFQSNSPAVDGRDARTIGPASVRLISLRAIRRQYSRQVVDVARTKWEAIGRGDDCGAAPPFVSGWEAESLRPLPHVTFHRTRVICGQREIGVDRGCELLRVRDIGGSRLRQRDQRCVLGEVGAAFAVRIRLAAVVGLQHPAVDMRRADAVTVERIGAGERRRGLQRVSTQGVHTVAGVV